MRPFKIQTSGMMGALFIIIEDIKKWTAKDKKKHAIAIDIILY